MQVQITIMFVGVGVQHVTMMFVGVGVQQVTNSVCGGRGATCYKLCYCVFGH